MKMPRREGIRRKRNTQHQQTNKQTALKEEINKIDGDKQQYELNKQ